MCKQLLNAGFHSDCNFVDLLSCFYRVLVFSFACTWWDIWPNDSPSIWRSRTNHARRKYYGDISVKETTIKNKCLRVRITPQGFISERLLIIEGYVYVTTVSSDWGLSAGSFASHGHVLCPNMAIEHTQAKLWPVFMSSCLALYRKWHADSELAVFADCPLQLSPYLPAHFLNYHCLSQCKTDTDLLSIILAECPDQWWRCNSEVHEYVLQQLIWNQIPLTFKNHSPASNTAAAPPPPLHSPLLPGPCSSS